MKVLRDNYTTQTEEIKQVASYPRKFVCENCKSELEYDKDDLRIGAYGAVFLDCPLCGYDNMFDDHEDSIILTKDNIEYPTHYHHVCTDNGAVDCCDNEHIKKYLNEAIAYFRKNKDDYSWGTHVTGNLFMNVHRWSGDECYEVSISNDFYSMEIPFEPEDY